MTVSLVAIKTLDDIDSSFGCAVCAAGCYLPLAESAFAAGVHLGNTRKSAWLILKRLAAAYSPAAAWDFALIPILASLDDS